MDLNLDLKNINALKDSFPQAEALAAYINPAEANDRAAHALNLILRFGGIDGSHHKDWTIDQVVRLLTGDKYDEFVTYACGDVDEDGDTEYSWETGIAP